ncbi:TonB-dependent receptor [Edaphobacter bradus]|uniref:TonB-dependent receptor n=1 Tax=Edaphobacter bradus TaxID=2259016 RepID=UPI0021E0722E|nr:TonB-dependent receptor [Edaphobacter bradus]
MKQKKMAVVAVVCLFFVSGTLMLLGQAVSGSLVGTVQDSTGASVVKATVTATETGTGTTYEAVTNDTGNYTVPSLPPGSYTVTVTAAGFKKIAHENIDVLLNSTTRVDFEVVPGSVNEEVLVTAAPPLLQTDRADISTKLDTRQVAELPLGTNRNFQSLLNLVPGTAPARYEHSQFFNAQGALQTEANGLPRHGNLYQIEGIDDDERTGLLQIIIPPAEAIQSVDISTNNFDAELGRATGAVTNVVLKSGTNSFHGSAFEFIQNDYVNARSYFGPPLGHLSYNYFGGSIGGPVLKDKLFFFGDYLRTSDHEKIANTFTIPPPIWYTPNPQGFIDLSGPLASGAGQIYDPATGDGTAQHPRTPFANNQIPIGRVNPVSLRILQELGKVAQPNQNQGNLVNPTNNYGTKLPFTKTTDSFDIKINYTLDERNHVSGRYSWQRVITFQAPAFGSFLGGPAGGGGFQGTGHQKSYSVGVNYDHVFSSTLFTEARFGVAHLRNNAQPSDFGSNDATAIGIPGVNIDQFTSGQVGIFIGNGLFGQQGQNYPLIGYSASVPWIRGESNIDFVNMWTKIIHNHTVKAGVDLRRVRDDLLQDQTFSPRGAYTFAEPQTSDLRGKTNIANDIASFLLDVPSQVGRDVNTYFPAYRQWWFFAFASDKWQATSKLTVDMGVRWEFYPPATPRKAGGFSNYDPVNNRLVIAGIGGNPSNLGMETRYRYWAPRTGFSYRATDNTVIRGGFGMSYTPFPDNVYAYNYPVRSNNAYTPVGSSPFTPAVLADGVTVATFEAGFPAPVAVPIPSNGIIPANTKTLLAQQYFVIPLKYKNPYAESWNVAVQQALPSNMSLQVAYVANHGVDISAAQNINFPSVYGGGAASIPENIAFGRTAATNQYFLPYSSNFQSLQLQLNKRFSNGLAFTSAFTWGKALGYISGTVAPANSGDNGGLIFFINQRRNYARLDFDRAYNFEQSFTYELPFGRGHSRLNTGVAAVALGGWKVSGIISAVSGTSFSVYANPGSLNTPGTAQTANLTGTYRVTHGIGPNTHWLDVTAFSQPSGCPAPPTPCTAQNVGLGNTGRNQFHGPGYIQDNLSVFKSFPIWREAAVETRFDAFQLSNTPQFNNPNAGSGNIITSANFGRVTSTLGSGQGSVNGVGGGRSLQASVRVSF